MLDWGSKLYEITSNTTYYWLRILLQDMYDCVEQTLAGDYKYFYYYYYWLRTFDPRSGNKMFDTLFKSRASWWMDLNYLIYVLFGYLWLTSSWWCTSYACSDALHIHAPHIHVRVMHHSFHALHCNKYMWKLSTNKCILTLWDFLYGTLFINV